MIGPGTEKNRFMSLIWELVEAIESTIDVNQQQGAESDAKQQMCRNTKTGQ